jgi:hypothetical protein
VISAHGEGTRFGFLVHKAETGYGICV